MRIDGKNFHKFSDVHQFEKPNDTRGLNLMNFAAACVMKEFNEIIISYGQSDEYSFVFHRSADVYNRRASKILTNVNSLFTSSYVFNWNRFFENQHLKYPPCFDGRIVLYPTVENLKDYLSWRQADVHINNLFNTCFWNLVKSGLTNQEAEERLRGTVSADKNEILFSEFGINYNNLPAMFRKGTILMTKQIKIEGSKSKKKVVVPVYDDLIREKFWLDHDELLDRKPPKMFEFPDKELPQLVTELLRINK